MSLNFLNKSYVTSSNRLTNFSLKEKQSTEYPRISTLYFYLIEAQDSLYTEG